MTRILAGEFMGGVFWLDIGWFMRTEIQILFADFI